MNNSSGKSVSPRSSHVKKKDQLTVQDFIELYKVIKIEEIKGKMAEIENDYEAALFNKFMSQQQDNSPDMQIYSKKS